MPAHAVTRRDDESTTAEVKGDGGFEGGRRGRIRGRGGRRGEFVHLTKSKGRFVKGLLFVWLREGERREGRVGEGSCGTDVGFIAFGGRKGSLASAVGTALAPAAVEGT